MDYHLVKPDKLYLRRQVDNDTLLLFYKGNIGIGVNVDDHMDGSDNTITFILHQGCIWMIAYRRKITLDDIGYDETRYINAYADYEIKQKQNKWVQCLFKLPGNHLDHIYSHLNDNNGRLQWSDKGIHKVEVVLTDDKNSKAG